MKCVKCNAEVAEGTKFCPECGNSMTAPTPPKKKITKKQGCLGCLGFVVVVIIMTAVMGALFGNKDKPASTQKTQQTEQTQKQEKAAPEFTCNVEGIGKVKGAISSNVGIAIANVSEANEVGGKYHKVQAQGKYVVLKIVVYNNQKDPITVDSNSYKLIDDQKREFAVSTEALTAIHMSNGNAKGFLNKINPGLTTMVEFPFEVPKEAKGLQLQARGGFTGEKILLPLKVQLVQ